MRFSARSRPMPALFLTFTLCSGCSLGGNIYAEGPDYPAVQQADSSFCRDQLPASYNGGKALGFENADAD